MDNYKNFKQASFELAEKAFKDWINYCKKTERQWLIPVGASYDNVILLWSALRPYEAFKEDVALSYHFLLRWRDCGYPTFDITHALAEKFILTDCSSIKGRDLEFPFQSFLINLPYPKTPIVINNLEVRSIVYHSIMVGSKKRSIKMFRNNHQVLAVETVDFPKDNETLEEWIEIKNLDKEEKLSAGAAKAASRIIVNLALHLDALKQDGQEWPRQPSSSSKRDAGPALPPAWILGRGVKLDPKLREAARQVTLPKSRQSAAWKLESQHVVRGHWRMQHYGPGLCSFKKIHIDPYWKGPRLSEAVLRNFTSSDNGEK